MSTVHDDERVKEAQRHYSEAMEAIHPATDALEAAQDELTARREALEKAIALEGIEDVDVEAARKAFDLQINAVEEARIQKAAAERRIVLTKERLEQAKEEVRGEIRGHFEVEAAAACGELAAAIWIRDAPARQYVLHRWRR